MHSRYEALAAAFEPLLPPLPLLPLLPPEPPLLLPLEPLLPPLEPLLLPLEPLLLPLEPLLLEPDDVLELPLSLDDDVDELLDPLSPLDFDSGLLDEYRSLYQPLPLSWNAVREMSRSSALAPHASHSVLSGSLIRCWYSNSL